MRNPEDPGLTQLTMEMTRIKMGHGSTLTQQVQAALAEAEAAAKAEGMALPVRQGDWRLQGVSAAGKGEGKQ